MNKNGAPVTIAVTSSAREPFMAMLIGIMIRAAVASRRSSFDEAPSNDNQARIQTTPRKAAYVEIYEKVAVTLTRPAVNPASSSDPNIAIPSLPPQAYVFNGLSMGL